LKKERGKMKTEVVSEVQHIIEVLNERVNGYEKGIENVDDAECASLFNEYKQQAQQFEMELQPFAEINIDEIGTRLVGDVWHFWMDLKGAITNKSITAIIGACITGEEAAIRNYEEILDDENLPNELREILGRQLEDIKVACENLIQIKENF
jgi:uncharacterized protein (TIGR02284 family)